MKIRSLPKHEHLQVTKYCEKEEKLLLRSNFSSFPQYFQHISNFKSPITYTFVKCGCSIYFFLNSSNLICRGTDISRYFRESIRIRDNESRLYFLCINPYREMQRKSIAYMTYIKRNPEESLLTYLNLYPNYNK